MAGTTIIPLEEKTYFIACTVTGISTDWGWPKRTSPNESNILTSNCLNLSRAGVNSGGSQYVRRQRLSKRQCFPNASWGKEPMRYSTLKNNKIFRQYFMHIHYNTWLRWSYSMNKVSFWSLENALTEQILNSKLKSQPFRCAYHKIRRVIQITQ